MNYEDIISRDPDVTGGIPVFAGTRVPVVSLIDHLKAGDSLDDFLDSFPTVTRLQAQSFLDLALQTALNEAANARTPGRTPRPKAEVAV